LFVCLPDRLIRNLVPVLLITHFYRYFKHLMITGIDQSFFSTVVPPGQRSFFMINPIKTKKQGV
jgi:hypothetical protein